MGWGDENWGTMIWSYVPKVDAIGDFGLGVLVLAMGLSGVFLLRWNLRNSTLKLQRWVLFLLVLLPTGAIGVTLPYLFQNGTLADATQVNNNFSALVNGIHNHEAQSEPHHTRYTDAEAFQAQGSPPPLGAGETYSSTVETATGDIINAVQCTDAASFDGLTPDCTISQTFNRTPGSQDEPWSHSAQFNQEFSYAFGAATNYHSWVEQNVDLFTAASALWVTGFSGTSPDEGYGLVSDNNHVTTLDGSSIVTGNAWIETWGGGNPAKVNWAFSDPLNPPADGQAFEGDSTWTVLSTPGWGTLKIVEIFDGATCTGTPIAHANIITVSGSLLRLRYRPGSDLSLVSDGDCIRQLLKTGSLSGSPSVAFTGTASDLAVPGGCGATTPDVGACNVRHQSLTIDPVTSQLHFFLRSKESPVIFNVRAPHPASGHQYVQIHGNEQYGTGGPRLIVGASDTYASTQLFGDLAIADPTACPGGVCVSTGRIILHVSNGDNLNYIQTLPNMQGTHVVARGAGNAGPTFWGDANDSLTDTGEEVCAANELPCDGAAEINGTDLTCNQQATGTPAGRYLVFCR